MKKYGVFALVGLLALLAFAKFAMFAICIAAGAVCGGALKQELPVTWMIPTAVVFAGVMIIVTNLTVGLGIGLGTIIGWAIVNRQAGDNRPTVGS